MFVMEKFTRIKTLSSIKYKKTVSQQHYNKKIKKSHVIYDDISGRISEKLIEDQMNRSSDEMKVQEKSCLDMEFMVKSQFIVPFSQKITLYEIKSQKQSQKILPKQVSSKTANEIRKSIQLMQKSISSPSQNKEEDDIQVTEASLNVMDQDRRIQNLFFPYIISALIALLILWIAYLEFLHVVIILVVGALAIIYYLSTQKYLLSKIPLKSGYYKVSISGMISTPTNYNNNSSLCFYLYAGFSSWNRQILKIYFQSNYSYAYPFNATFLVESKKEQELCLELQKTKLNNLNVQNVVITTERLSLLSKIK